MKAEEVAETLLDLLYPRSCQCCPNDTDHHGHYLCWECLADIPLIQPPFCAQCGDPISGRADHAYRCRLCTSRKPAFDLARSAALFEGALRESLLLLKYHQGLWMVSDLADLIMGAISAYIPIEGIDVVTCVPLHPLKYRIRGYNQSALLAREIARRIDKPFRESLLRRTRYTPSQTKLTANRRAANVKGAFATRRPEAVCDRRILLVDDVMTTGATVYECSRVLKAAGASAITVVTAARG